LDVRTIDRWFKSELTKSKCLEEIVAAAKETIGNPYVAASLRRCGDIKAE
jgi:hypothetical protein